MTARVSEVTAGHRTQFRPKKKSPGGPGKIALDRTVDVCLRVLAIREEVQQRIASDLHDSTCQHLIAVSLNLTRLRCAIDQGGDAARLCDDIDASIDEAIREIRAFTYILYPPSLLADGLKSTVEQFVRGFSLRAALQAELAVAADADDLPIPAQRAVLRVVQEALMNVFRHAKASKVKVEIEASRIQFVLRISDDGCGMPATSANSGSRSIPSGVGISAMRARLRKLGATLEISTSSEAGDHGTTLSAVIPRAGSRHSVRRRAGLCADKVMLI